MYTIQNGSSSAELRNNKLKKMCSGRVADKSAELISNTQLHCHARLHATQPHQVRPADSRRLHPMSSFDLGTKFVEQQALARPRTLSRRAAGPSTSICIPFDPPTPLQQVQARDSSNPQAQKPARGWWPPRNRSWQAQGPSERCSSLMTNLAPAGSASHVFKSTAAPSEDPDNLTSA